MTYNLYKQNLEHAKFKQRTIYDVTSEDWNMVEMLAGKYPCFHARYMKTDYKKMEVKNNVR